MPSLRERREDIPRLAEHFVALFGERKNPPIRGLDSETLALLSSRDWHANNVRELRNVIQLCVDLTPTELISPDV
ncbi:MAG: sigma-54-dependent Fis family transcriptional regulator, partial [Planctomycetia bacterium]|nr:sigma-54-dependent Fis family transcriptional regulator [Planctomycetia bacterium]